MGLAFTPTALKLALRSEDWTAVMVIASIALVGLLYSALGVSVDQDERR
jgi:hypothetical protein